MAVKGSITANIFYGLDVATGLLLGNRCPNCRSRDSRTIHPKRKLNAVYQCQTCLVLFRSVGLQNSKVADFYYSSIYDGQGIATLPAVMKREEVIELARRESKDRSSLLDTLIDIWGNVGSVGVFGATWGYEMMTFEKLGLPVWGVELGDLRREFGRRHYGLDIAKCVDSVPRIHESSLIFSSHVLEHIPELETALQGITSRPEIVYQIHITPRVDPIGGSTVRNSVGREHPIGVTHDFWTRWAQRNDWTVQQFFHEPSGEDGANELLSILCRKDKFVDLNGKISNASSV